MSEATGEKDVKVYPGTEISVTWQRKLCIHVGECGRADDELFMAKRDPWCDPDEVSVERVSEVVERCPTGALSYTRVDNHQENRPSENTVHVACNGPLYLRGQLEIQGIDQDMKGLKYRAALCRCGASQNKPFCDGSHTEAQFEDAGAVGESGEVLPTSNGPLKVNPAKNGPLVLRGNMSIYSGSGRKAWQGQQVSLCRCGASANKPFCDGSHNR
jgi:CDGSH-type Zn-finger protein/uncharacterized Fe-S cluster protein YjdI